MNSNIFDSIWFGNDVERNDNASCPRCGSDELTDSGLCIVCQDNEYDDSINEDDDEIIRK